MSNARDQIGRELVEAVRATMQTLGRNATGRASDSLRYEVRIDGVDVFGVDYFEQIDKGTPAGTVVDLSNLVEWVAAKFGERGRRGVRIAYRVRQNIYERGAPSDPSKLDVLDKSYNAALPSIRQLVDRDILRLTDSTLA